MRRAHYIFTFILLYSTSVHGQLMGGWCEDSTLCAKHGKCMDGWMNGTFWCRCDNGYGGGLCERECHLRCGSDKKCVYDALGNPTCICNDCVNEAYTDEKDNCPPGFGGPHCNTNFEDPCFPNPCNNGKCYPFNFGYQCICDNGFSGAHCTEGTDHCKNHNCTNGSECVNTITGYYCACPPGKSGAFCSISSCALLGNVCNHGECINLPFAGSSGKSFDCLCEDGYEGEFCTQDKNECLGPVCTNNSTCINVAGSFVCNCQTGYTGKICDIPVDMCEGFDCGEGECSRMPDQTPVCSCKTGYTGVRCERKCPPGVTGIYCDLPLSKPHCSRDNGPCYNGGKCISGFCKCPPQFIGDRCEHERDKTNIFGVSSCDNNFCENNSTCVNLAGGYACICTPGFYGPNCERFTCAPTTCANGGDCSAYSGGLVCSCPPGFYGKYCEKRHRIKCSKNPCMNGGNCLEFGIGNSNGNCQCVHGFGGVYCQEKLDDDNSYVKYRCNQPECVKVSSNGFCDPQCNFEECGFDGGDCSGGQKPFSKCSHASICAKAFANGVCNQVCDKEECLYDGFDCQSGLHHCPANIRQHCIERRDNGVCDWECSFIGCGFDGGDCNNGTEALILSDIRIKVQIDPAEFQSTGEEILMDISAHLRAIVRIQKDELGPLVFKWDGDKETDRIEMDSNKLARQKVLSHHFRKNQSVPQVSGIILYLEVEEICQPQSKCRFSTAQSVVDLIAAGLTKSNGSISLGLPVTEAMVAAPPSNEGSNVEWLSKNQILLISVIAFLAFGTVAAGVIAKPGEPEGNRKRKIINAPVWVPSTETSVPKTSASLNRSSLLDNSEYLTGAKRMREGFKATFDGRFYHINPNTFTNAGNFEGNRYQFNQNILNTPQKASVDYNLLHLQASGPGAITEPITFESVNQVSSKLRRGVLHCLAGNEKGKPEELIIEETKRCLEAGADVNAPDSDYNTALMLAIRARRNRLAVILLHGGANPTVFNNSERSALHEAVVNRDVRMVTILLTDLRILRDIDELDRNGMTALMHSARSLGDSQVPIAKLLLEKGAKIDADGGARKESEKYRGRTALHYAAMADNVKMIEFLLSKNSNKDKQDEDGRTPIMLAAREGHDEAVKSLVQNGASLSIVDAMDKSATQHAMDNFHHEIADYLKHMSVHWKRREAMIMMNPPLKQNTSTRGRHTMRTVKRAGSRRDPLVTSSTSSLSGPSSSGISSSPRESKHLTPPPSGGSFSPPSPHYFPISSSTPAGIETSPEQYVHNNDITNLHPWYTSSPSFSEQQMNHQQSPQTNNLPPMNIQDEMNGSFYI